MNNNISQKSLKKNFLLNNMRLFLSFALPLITFPYISRILGTTGIGKVEFANSVVSYFVLFASLGIPNYGIREIARVRDKKRMLSKTVAELSLILIITVIIGYVFYFTIISFVPIFCSEKLLFLIVAPSIFLSAFNYEWFYQGIEDQSYITSRFIVVKLIQVVLLFFLVRKSDDFYIYAGLLVGMNCVSSLFNVFHLKKYVSFVSIKNLSVRRHLKSVIIIFVSVVAVSVYTQLDITMIGFFRSDSEVGIYTAANRVVRMVLMLVTSLSPVIIPKIENSLKNGNFNEYQHYLSTSLGFIILFAFPCLIGIEILADELIFVFAGNRFFDAVKSIRFLAPIIIIVGLANFVGLQVLYANRKEKIYTMAVGIAAFVNFFLNLLFIPKLGQIGAVIGTIVAESIGLLVMSFVGRKILFAAKLKISVWKYLLSSILMGFFVLFLRKWLNFLCLRKIFVLIVCVVFGVTLYGFSLFVLRENMSVGFLKELIKKVFANKNECI